MALCRSDSCHVELDMNVGFPLAAAEFCKSESSYTSRTCWHEARPSHYINCTLHQLLWTWGCVVWAVYLIGLELHYRKFSLKKNFKKTRNALIPSELTKTYQNWQFRHDEMQTCPEWISVRWLSISCAREFENCGFEAQAAQLSSM